MRIIAGKYRGRNLKSPPSLKVRPTSDRLRETLFNILAARITGARFLDLCAGSGAVGIEALSRRAAHATFVDQSRAMCLLIKTNLDLLRVDEAEHEVVQAEAGDYLRRAVGLSHTLPWDIIYFDPPYADDYLPILNSLGRQTADVLTANGLLIVEHFHKNRLPDAVSNLNRIRVLKQGDSALSFYQLINETPAAGVNAPSRP